MYALHQDLVSANGVEYATFLHLTPSSTKQSTGSSVRVIANLVVARSNVLRIFEVREEPAPLPTLEEEEGRTKNESIKPGTEAMEGEVEMDEEGEGFVNMAQVKTLPQGLQITPYTVTRLFLLCEYKLHGVVTGIQRVKTIASSEDGMDRVLISFKDAKISLMEWSEIQHDLSTVSIHTYERTPQVLTMNTPDWRSKLRVDPLYRCAALTLPRDALAILPFHSSAELEMMEQERGLTKDIPYAPSFVLDLTEVDGRIRNVLDLVFMPGFNNSTIAVACQTTQTWTGRLNEFKDTVSIFIITLDTFTRTYPVISQIHGLPYDVLYLVACPPALGGLFAVTANAILHVDQSSRTVGIAVNGWANRVTSSTLPVQVDSDGTPFDLKLEGSSLVLVNENSVVLFMADGDTRTVKTHMDGRTVARLEVSPSLAVTSPASVVCVSDDEHLFVGSTAGPSTLLKAIFTEKVVEVTETTSVPVIADLDMELDEEIYGDMAAQTVAHSTSGPSAERVMILELALRDSLPGHGIISHMAFGVTAEDGQPELIACTGIGKLGGLTRFTKHIPMRTKRKLPVIGGSQGIWSISVKRSTNANMDKANSDGRHTMILSTNATPAPGLSRIMTAKSSGDLQIIGRTPGITIAAGAFFQNTCVVQVLTDAIRLLEPDARERLSIKDPAFKQSKIIEAFILDPYILIRRENGSLSMYVGDTMEQKINSQDHTELPTCQSACLFNDKTGTFQTPTSGENPQSGLEGLEQLENVLDTERGTYWAILVTTAGELQIRSLPLLTVVFSSNGIASLLPILTYNADENMNGDESPAAGFNVHQVLIASIGESGSPSPRLLLLTTNGVLSAYDIHPLPAEATRSAPSNDTLSIVLVKTLTRALGEIPRSSTTAMVPARKLVPIETDLGDQRICGVFCTGARPFWLLSVNWSPLRLYPTASPVVHALAPCSVFGSRGDFLIHTDEGPALTQWVGDVQLGLELPFRSVLVGRQYTAVAFDSATQHVITVSSQKARFALFDEEGSQVWSADGPGISDPVCESSCLELLSPDTWTTIDGYEFAHNEYVNVAESVSLETLSAEKGEKDFIVVGTTIYRGEDLAVKGATYVFDVVEVVRQPGSLKRKNKLKLLCRDEAKGPITAVAGINGYLVSAMGQKMYVRAFDLDERLIGMAFLDIGLYVTNIRTMKNLILISDAVKSVWFICFQEDPFKLVLLAKDYEAISATNANFFFGTGKDLAFVATDENGIVRMYHYNPMDPDSNNGQRLICRTEFDAQEEHKAVLTVLQRLSVSSDEDTDESAGAQSLLICANLAGAISILSPVDAARYKRLSLLQGQLVKNIQHTGGLNPKGFRTVRNEKVSRPLSKGILDAGLLSSFIDLELGRQAEVTKQIGTERELILEDLEILWTVW